jgi:hypothetical protein
LGFPDVSGTGRIAEFLMIGEWLAVSGARGTSLYLPLTFLLLFTFALLYTFHHTINTIIIPQRKRLDL